MEPSYPTPQKGAHPQFLAHVYYGQMVAHLSYWWALAVAASKHTTAPINHTRPSPRKHSPDVTTPSEMPEPDYCLLLIYRPRKNERLSWPSWLTCSGWLTHISGHPAATGRAQDRKFTGWKTDVLPWFHATKGKRSSPVVRYSDSLPWAVPIEMPFGIWTPMGPKKHALDGVSESI